MTAAVCPYCQGAISDSDEFLLCNGCETPHHKDCYEENQGCTVFGCKCAPPEEPKMTVSTPELVSVGAAAAAAPAVVSNRASAPPPPPAPGMSVDELQQIAYRVVPSIFSTYDDTPVPAVPEQTQPREPKNRMGFMILGVLLGPFGAHNWYAGYYKKAIAQLAITVLTVGFGAPMSWIWAIIDICTVDRDKYGTPFTS